MLRYRLTVSLLLGGALLASPAGAEKIRSAVPGLNLNYLSIFAAEARGFFKDENLENETIVIGGPAGIAALVSGDVDFSGAGGSGLRAAVKGAPLKAIMYQTERPTWYLVVHPSIAQVSDLKGKRIGVALIGDSEDRFTTLVCRARRFVCQGLDQDHPRHEPRRQDTRSQIGSGLRRRAGSGGNHRRRAGRAAQPGVLGRRVSHALSRLRRHRQKDRGKSGAGETLDQSDGAVLDVHPRAARRRCGYRHEKTCRSARSPSPC